MIIYITFGSYISKEYYKPEENIEFWAWEENVGLCYAPQAHWEWGVLGWWSINSLLVWLPNEWGETK